MSDPVHGQHDAWGRDFDVDVDVVVVGSGAAGLSAALTARARGLEVVLLERAGLVGGSSMLAGGGIWVPCNCFMTSDTEKDTPDDALAYMEALIGDAPPASSRARKEAFVLGAPRMLEFLQSLGVRFRRTGGYPDYFPDVVGASVAGRGVESVVFDTRLLGDWADRLPSRSFPRNLPMGTLDVSRVVLARRTWSGFARLARIYGHHWMSRARGQRLVGGGGALVSQLLYQALRRDVSLRMETPVVELITDAGVVVGVVARGSDGPIRIHARRGVHVGAGGFARNDEMRQRHHPHPISAAWSSAHPGDLGDGITLGVSVGADTDLMDEAWWGPASLLSPPGPAVFHVSERSKPGSLVVDQGAGRYFNESIDYVVAGQTMFQRHRTVNAIPSFLIFDQRYRNRYPFGACLPGVTPRRLIDSGYFRRADSLAGLAHQCGLPAANLEATVARFNTFARSGVDEDFARGGNAYDRYYGDPRVRPNPCLGRIDKPPFYAVALYPGDLGTKGGLVTDEHGRVLRPDGRVIQGLYASGNTTASVMGRCYPGAGVTLAPAMTFSWLAMRHLAAATPRQSADRTAS